MVTVHTVTVPIEKTRVEKAADAANSSKVKFSSSDDRVRRFKKSFYVAGCRGGPGQPGRGEFMIRGLYTAASGMQAQQHRLDALSNNLANVDLTGYKKDTSVHKAFPEMLMPPFQ